jgi:hypothetical protein
MYPRSLRLLPDATAVPFVENNNIAVFPDDELDRIESELTFLIREPSVPHTFTQKIRRDVLLMLDINNPSNLAPLENIASVRLTLDTYHL